ncbi:MAG: aldo/keto reductase [candidate division KSB1 bacterium]|nr:aldo/keto reductase [candidate division KSB1 bacterium]
MKRNNISRRSFIKRSAQGALTVTVAGELVRQPLWAMDNEKIVPQYRTLGKTGLSFTTLGFGCMRTSDPAVIRAAFDRGVNNFDTARVYMGGDNEEIVGKALKDVRKDAFITTKVKVSTIEQMRKDVQKSLKALQTDYVDILLLHGRSDIADLERNDLREFLASMKEQGKTRFVGFSTHSNMAELLNYTAENGFYDVVLTAYNFKSDENLQNAVKTAREAGIGVIAMKTQAGGYQDGATETLSAHQAALKWALSDSNVTSAIPAIQTFDHLNENIKVMGSKMGFLDRKSLHRYGNIIDHKLCRMCGACKGQCPSGVSLADLNRCVMYADGYKDYQLALENYQQLGARRNVSQCETCDECVIECPNHLDPVQTIRRASQLFT